MDAQVARNRLETMLVELDESAKVLQRSGGAETGELSTVDQHPADFATNTVDADREEASLEVIVAQRGRIDEAMARIDAGTYGKCIDCGQPLPDERLEARPEAARCVQCQQRFEGRR